MKNFFDKDILLDSENAAILYDEVKDLPIIDYHCHLDQKQIESDAKFENLGQAWLSCDHYKWRAMRMCGVDEYYITGAASWKEKFIKYASIMPKLIGNPLYYWSHLELHQVFGISRTISATSAEDIYREAEIKIKDISVKKLLKDFRVEFVATTDDPSDDLAYHKRYGGVSVTPTFRPDKVLSLDGKAIKDLGVSADMEIKSFEDIKTALCRRLDHFVTKGCRISDHGFLDFPKSYTPDDVAETVYARTGETTAGERDGLFGNLLVFLMREYHKRDIIAQLHFAVQRNINTQMFYKVGADSGFDVMAPEADTAGVIRFLDKIPDAERPVTILYSLNPNSTAALACISGAFRNVFIGAAWWFNDSVEGIKRNLSIISEYSCLGTNLGMLTDSRSFLSYSRFDFFRRILCSFVGDKVECGQYSFKDAKMLVKDICYNNVKKLLRVENHGCNAIYKAV